MLICDITVDPASITVALYTVLAGLVGIAYFLGRYTAKVDGVIKEQQDLRSLIGQIYDRIDDIAKNIPHQCVQIDRLARVESVSADNVRRISDLEHGSARNIGPI